MKKISFYLLAFSYVFGQTSVDTLSVTIYPEFSYPGVAIEYKFDKFGKDEIVFPVSSSIDSVLYTISGEGLEFEQILKTSRKIAEFYKDSVSTGEAFIPLRKEAQDPRAVSLKAQLDNLVLKLDKKSNTLATIDEAYRVQKLIEEISDATSPYEAAGTLRIDEIIQPSATRIRLARDLGQLANRKITAPEQRPLSYWPTC